MLLYYDILSYYTMIYWICIDLLLWCTEIIQLLMVLVRDVLLDLKEPYMAQRVVSPFSTGRPFSTEPSSMYLNMHAKTIRVQLFSAQVSSVVDIACSEDLFHWSSHPPTQPETSWLNHMIKTCKQHLSRRKLKYIKKRNNGKFPASKRWFSSWYVGVPEANIS